MKPLAPLAVEVTARYPDGRIKATWPASLLASSGGCHLIAATWSRDDRYVGPLHFAPGDVLIERYDENRWFNVFAVWDRGAGRLRGFYVNLSAPVSAETRQGRLTLAYTDFGLDYVVTRNEALELDIDDWRVAEAGMAGDARQAAEAAIAELRRRILDPGPEAAWRWLREQVEGCVSGPGVEFLAEAAGRWGVPLVYRDRVEFWSTADVDHWLSMYERGERVAEAIYVLRLPGGQTLLHTKAFYPAGVFRLPGGGIARGEAPWDAAVREAAEETGLATRPAALLGYADVELVAATGSRVTMPNYIFLLEPLEPGAEPVPSAEEGISEFRRIPWEDLAASAEALLNLEGRWRHWGHYRAIGHQLAYQAIRDGHGWA